MAMTLETVESELQSWGELMITTSAGQTYEIHLGDTEFDLKNRILRLRTPHSDFVIEGDSIEAIQKHYGHRVDGDKH